MKPLVPQITQPRHRAEAGWEWNASRQMLRYTFSRRVPYDNRIPYLLWQCQRHQGVLFTQKYPELLIYK